MNNKPVYPCDMHCHTTRSDGNDSPYELISNAVAQGLYAIGICDHDMTPPLTVTLPDGSERDTLEYGESVNLRIVLGYEFSCDTHVDDVHICGYRLDWSAPQVIEEVEAAKRSKSQAYENLCHLLTEHGMPLDWESDILRYLGIDGTEATRQPDEVQRKHVFEAIARRGYTDSWSDAKILVRDNPQLNVPRRKIDSLDAIALIHQAGGLAVLAHPHLIDETTHPNGQPTLVPRDAYIDRLIEAGLDGIEGAYSYDKTTYKGSSSPEEVEAEIRMKFGDRVRIISGGSDYHADAKKASKKVRSLGERGISIEDFKKFL